MDSRAASSREIVDFLRRTTADRWDVSAYCCAQRATPLTPAEKDRLVRVVSRYNGATPDPAGARSPPLRGWEGFVDWMTPEDDEPDELPTVFGGSAALLRGYPDAVSPGLAHWAAMFTELRVSVPDASWDCRVEHFGFVWDQAARNYSADRLSGTPTDR